MGTTADTYVRARIDRKTKERASAALEAMGLSISDAIRMLMFRVAEEGRLPFYVMTTNSTGKPKLSVEERIKQFDPVLHKSEKFAK